MKATAGNGWKMAWIGTEGTEHVSERMELLMPWGAEVDA